MIIGKGKLKIALIIILFLSPITFDTSRAENSKHILVIFSLQEGMPIYKLFIENLQLELREENYHNYKLFTEYLMTNKFQESHFHEYFFDKINKKYSTRHIDEVVFMGPNIIQKIEKYADKYLKKIPAILIDYKSEFEKYKNYSFKSSTKEIPISFYPEKNFILADKLFPECDSIFVVTGNDAGTESFHKFLSKVSKEYEKKRKIIDLSSLNMKAILDTVSRISPDNVIMAGNFSVDADSVPYFSVEAVRLMADVTSAPIFVSLDTPFDEGAFGGYVLSLKNLGTETGSAVIQMLNGTPPKKVRINESDLNQYMFDWRELKKRGLENSELIPPGSIILYHEIDFFTKYKWFLASGILFLILQFVLIVSLIRLNRIQKRTTIRLIESETRFRELIREDRIQRMGQMTASLSHELNQPLTAIRNTAQAGLNFLRSGRLNPEQFKDILKDIIDDDKRASGIIMGVRDLMKLEKREKEKIDITLKVKQIIDIFKSESNKRNIKLHINIPGNPVYVLADRIQIQQVLLNLIFNAANSMEENRTSNKTIIINQTINNSSVITSVRDFGHGINDKIKDKLFQPFITTRQEGFGIGLAVSKSILEDHGGKIWAENNPDGGATFFFQLNLYNNGS